MLPFHQYASAPLSTTAALAHDRLRHEVAGLVESATADAITGMAPFIRAWGLTPTALPKVTARAAAPSGATPGVYELPLGTPLRTLLVDIAGAHDIKAVFSGVSAPVIHPDRLDTPLTYEDMRTAGTGLGSGGFIVYDRSHCIVRVAIELSNFLAIESCAQCAACKLGCTAITELLRLIEAGEAAEHHLDAIADRLPHITDQTRCALPAGEQLLIGSLLTDHRDEFIAHLGRTCHSEVTERVPKIDHLDDTTGEVTYDPHYHRKRPDWSFHPPLEDPSR